MKKIFNTFAYAAIAALALSSCAKENLKPSDDVTGKLVTVHFGTENTDPSTTKATLTPSEGETAFQAAWASGDVISVYYLNDELTEGTVPAYWNGSSFTADIPEYTGEWDYRAAYPVPDSEDNHVDFGPNRTQKGNVYNSLYDIMVGKAKATNAAAGKDDEGKDIVFKMDRQTAIAYFHFTSDLDEAITSATLTVGGEGAAIASNYAYISDFAWAPAEDCSSITVTFPEEAPNAKDFTLWFNVLETVYESMTLTVETANKTFTISKATEGVYEKGKLYKVTKYIDDSKWSDKGEGKTYGYQRISSVSDYEPGDYIIVAHVYKSECPTTGDFAISNKLEISSKKINGTDITSLIDNDVIYASDGVSYKLSLSGDKDNVVISNGTDKLGYDSSTNLVLNGEKTTWSLSLNEGDGGTFQLLNNSTQNASTKRALIFQSYTNNGASLKFGAYSVGNINNADYAAIELYKYHEVVPPTAKYSISFVESIGGTLSASSSYAEEGAEITLTATPDEGYEFNNEWSVMDSDNVEVTVTDGKFIMPAKNVTVTGSFSKVNYTITKATCEGGSFTVKKDGVEVSSAQIGETITLEASAAEGYEFSSWTVTNESTGKTVYVSENSFTMPGANVTVEANFVELAVVPVYSSLEELVNAGAPTAEETYVTVTLTNDEITGIYTTSKGYRNGIYFMVGSQEVEIYCQDVPEDWIVGGYVSGTLENCVWKLYGSTWELCPTDWTELSYAAPCATPEISLEGAVATITCATEGATVRYTLDETDPTETSTEYTSPVTLTDGQTIKAKAFLAGHKSSAVVSKKYTASTGVTTPTDVTFDFTKISDFSSWTTSYTKHTVEYDEGTITFDSANKQNGTITDQPVSKGGAVTLVMKNEQTINSFVFTCTKWGSKSQTITLHTSTDGGKTWTKTTNTSDTFSLSVDSLEGVNAIKFTFSSTSNQIGYKSLKINYNKN